MRRGALVALLPAVISGCTAIRTSTLEQGEVTMTQEQFAAHFERVFRYHNSIMNDLINDSADRVRGGDESRAISAAEATMDKSCEPLNDVVAAESVAETVDFKTIRRLPQAVPDCEVATRHLEILLMQLSETEVKATRLVVK
jgi:hypothetical protein